MLHDDLAEDFARMDIFQPDIGVDCCLHVAVTKKSSDELVLARPGLENESACRVPELMHCHAQPSRLINPLRDLTAEQGVGFGTSALSREQPVIVPATQRCRPELVDVLVDQSSEILLQR